MKPIESHLPSKAAFFAGDPFVLFTADYLLRIVFDMKSAIQTNTKHPKRRGDFSIPF
ncbi:MAG: hypothetical protein V4649_18390 [Bacteroidota bacterium]